MGEDKIAHSDAPLDVFDPVYPAIAKVLPANLAVQPAREYVIDLAALWEAFCPGVFLGMKFAPEGGRALTPMARGEGKELTCYKVAGICGYDAKKTGLGFCVTDGFQSFDLRRLYVHKAISATIAMVKRRPFAITSVSLARGGTSSPSLPETEVLLGAGGKALSNGGTPEARLGYRGARASVWAVARIGGEGAGEKWGGWGGSGEWVDRALRHYRCCLLY